MYNAIKKQNQKAFRECKPPPEAVAKITSVGLDIWWRYLPKSQPGCKWMIFITAVLTLNFVTSRVCWTMNIMCQISWKSDFHFSRYQRAYNELSEWTKQPCNKQTRPLTIPPGGDNRTMCIRHDTGVWLTNGRSLSGPKSKYMSTYLTRDQISNKRRVLAWYG